MTQGCQVAFSKALINWIGALPVIPMIKLRRMMVLALWESKPNYGILVESKQTSPIDIEK